MGEAVCHCYDLRHFNVALLLLLDGLKDMKERVKDLFKAFESCREVLDMESYQTSLHHKLERNTAERMKKLQLNPIQAPKPLLPDFKSLHEQFSPQIENYG